MGIILGSARIDENGNIAGGAAGDQTGSEVSTQSFYMHSQGWYCLRPKDANIANKIATAMKQACDNNNIGYDQNQRNTVLTQFRNYGSLGSIRTKCEADCSSLVRTCILQASGRDLGDFYTGNLASVLEASGLFEKRFSVSSESQLYNGDVLVTKSKGHTVIVVSGRARSGGSSGGGTNTGGATSWKATGTATCTDDKVNVRSGAGTNYSSLGYLSKGNRFEVDGKKSGVWVHVYVAGIGIGWVHRDYVKYDKTQSTTTTTWKAAGTATCTENNVNVRKTPNGTVIGRLGKGNRFEIDGEVDNGWTHVNVSGIGIGWVSSQYVKNDTPAKPSTANPSTWKATGTATCTENNVNVRKTPNGTVIGKLGKGNRFEIDGKNDNGWIHVNVSGIGVGYVAAQYVKTDVPTNSAWKATGTATCTDNSVNVRKTPNGTVIGKLGKGNRFEVDGQINSGWVHVNVAGIGIGWVSGDYVRYDA